MKFKHVLLAIGFVLLFNSCKKENKPFDQTSINTVYWDKFSLPTSSKKDALVLNGEVGNTRDIDSVIVTTNNVTTNTKTKVALARKDLTLTNRKDWPTSTIKWYQIKYKPKILVSSGDLVSFTLTAYTPFGTSQDLRSMITSSIEIE